MRAMIVSRHPAAVDFARDELARVAPNYEVVEVRDHLDDVPVGVDAVVGVLPLHLVARLTQAGIECLMIQLPNVPPERRGTELSIGEMREFGAHLARVKATLEPLRAAPARA